MKPCSHLKKINKTTDVVFEWLNESNQKLTVQLWNEYLVVALKIILETNPKRTVIIGPGNWNVTPSLSTPSLPKEDTNVIVTSHFYHSEAFHTKETTDEIQEPDFCTYLNCSTGLLSNHNCAA